jgi:hypothetical protein
MDFSKAFDTIRHHTLLEKLGSIDIPDHIFNWLSNYFHDRKHITKFQGEVSSIASINASVVQGSGVGPGSYVVGSADLHPKNRFNILVKYADDTYLLVGSSNIGTAAEEYDHVASWAKTNNLKLNPSKTREIIFSKRGFKASSIPIVIQGAERVDTIRVLGITLSSDMRMTKHTEKVLASSSTSLYALRVLRDHGMSTYALHDVAMATTVAHLMYASPAWWGYASETDRNKLQSMLNRMKRRGFLLSTTPSVVDMSQAADSGLFRAICGESCHVLRGIFPPTQQIKYNLRPRIHNFNLPINDKCNYIPRILFKDTY